MDKTRAWGTKRSRLWGSGIAIILSLAVAAACNDPEEQIYDSQGPSSPSSTDDPSPPSSEPGGTPGVSQIPGDILLSELRGIPVLESSNAADSAHPEDSAWGGEATRGFVGVIDVDDVLAFYEQELLTSGWEAETGPDEVSWMEADGKVYERIHWALTRNDLRLLIIINPDPNTGVPDEISWATILQPTWYPGFDSSGIPAPSTNTTPIPIYPGDASE